MKNIALTLSYQGTNYHGWQSQKNAKTVCDTLRGAVKRLSGEDVTLVGCGRTDAGVHARIYVANFRSGVKIPADRLPFAINALLPEDISVSCATEVPDSFHATYSCRGKEYTYYIYTSRIRDPFLKNRAFRHPTPLCAEAMVKAA
ncbi:MAG: tRNA pseudouridine synthase A, partial [Bacillota bacterium]|nr:tRNA pseudouridine synthase A [Bacillota bacterium]